MWVCNMQVLALPQLNFLSPSGAGAAASSRQSGIATSRQSGIAGPLTMTLTSTGAPAVEEHRPLR